MKSTSIRSYKELVESGELSKKQADVANCFKKWGPMTGRQLSEIIPGGWKRIREVADMGIIEPINTVLDFNTKKIVTVWGFCGEQPLLVPIKDTAKKVSKYDEGYADGIADAVMIINRCLLNIH